MLSDQKSHPLAICEVFALGRGCFADGGVSEPSDFRLARGAAGGYFGPGHHLNFALPLPGLEHNSFVAETFALVVCCCLTMVPLWITSDNKPVVQFAQQILLDPHLVIPWCVSARSFWIRFQTCVQQKPSGFFVVTWMPSHIREKHPQLLEDGIFTEKEVDWNDSADELASKALDGLLNTKLL